MSIPTSSNLTAFQPLYAFVEMSIGGKSLTAFDDGTPDGLIDFSFNRKASYVEEQMGIAGAGSVFNITLYDDDAITLEDMISSEMSGDNGQVSMKLSYGWARDTSTQLNITNMDVIITQYGITFDSAGTTLTLSGTASNIATAAGDKGSDCYLGNDTEGKPSKVVEEICEKMGWKKGVIEETESTYEDDGKTYKTYTRVNQSIGDFVNSLLDVSVSKSTKSVGYRFFFGEDGKIYFLSADNKSVKVKSITYEEFMEKYGGGIDTDATSIADLGCIKILLLGNSYTYYNGYGQMLSKIGKATGKDLLVVRATRGGESLKGLKSGNLEYKAWRKGKKVAGGKDKLSDIIKMPFGQKDKKGKWDYIVVQNNTDVNKTYAGDVDMYEYVKGYIDNSLHYIINCTHFSGSVNKNRLTEHKKAQTKCNCALIDVRMLFKKYEDMFSGRKWKNDLCIKGDDQHHASCRGMYINALATYAKIFGTSEFPTSADDKKVIKLYHKDGESAHEFVTDKYHAGSEVSRTIRKSDAVKLQYLVNKYSKKAIGAQLLSWSNKKKSNKKSKGIKSYTNPSDSFKKVSEKNGSTVNYYNKNSDMLILGDSRTVQMYNNGLNASFTAVWAGHYGYGKYRIDSDSNIKKAQNSLKKICDKQGSCRVFVIATINDYEGGSGYSSAVNNQIKAAEKLYDYAKKLGLSTTVYTCCLIPAKGKSVSKYNNDLKDKAGRNKKISYLNIKPSYLSYQSDDNVHYTKDDTKKIFKIMADKIK